MQRELLAQVGFTVKMEDIEDLLSRVLFLPERAICDAQNDLRAWKRALEDGGRSVEETLAVIKNIREQLAYADACIENVQKLYTSYHKTMLEGESDESTPEPTNQDGARSEDFSLTANVEAPTIGGSDDVG